MNKEKRKTKKYKYNPGDMVAVFDIANNLEAYGYVEGIRWYAPGKKVYVVRLCDKKQERSHEYGEAILDVWKERLDRYMDGQ